MSKLNNCGYIWKKLESIVGKNHLETEPDQLNLYARSATSQTTVPVAIIKPNSILQIQQILKIVHDYDLSIHPISTGKNWGYTDACAPTSGQIILDLGRMNKILEVNEELGYATIEPGVTQEQLYEYLENKKMNLWMDATGASSDTSIVGNILERGIGYSSYGDRFLHSCGYEIILPDGNILHTGFGHFENSKSTEIYKWGIGPSIDGLFTQANFGIITKMTVWLMPKPEAFKMLVFTLEKRGSIAEAMEKIRDLRLDGTIKSVVHVSNDIRMLTSYQRFPFNTHQQDQFLSITEKDNLLKLYRLDPWVGIVGFYGSKKQVKVNIERTRKKLADTKNIGKIFVIDSAAFKLIEIVLQFFRRFKIPFYIDPSYNRLKMLFNIFIGRAPTSVIFGGLWRVKQLSKIYSRNPLDYKGGFYWLSPITPMRSKDIKDLHNIVEPIFHKHGFDVIQTISTISDRALCSVLTICFDKENVEEVRRAEKCHDELTEAFIKNGYPMYRAGYQTMKFLNTGEKSKIYFDFIQHIKKAIDPKDVISPGKYIL